jgi:E3 ubiquitin-protein ligase SHPRH
MEEADEIIQNLLNAQSSLLWKWRTHLHGLLTESLTSNSEADGQEYSRTLETQGEAEMYLQAYAALMADRREVLVAERTALAALEHKEKKLRKTKVAAKAAAAEEIEIPEGLELQPEHEVIAKELADARRVLLMDFEGRAVKSIMVDLTAVAAKCPRDDDPEKLLAKDGATALRRLISAQSASAIVVQVRG